MVLRACPCLSFIIRNIVDALMLLQHLCSLCGSGMVRERELNIMDWANNWNMISFSDVLDVLCCRLKWWSRESVQSLKLNTHHKSALQEMVEREQRKNKEREAEKAEKAKAASNASSSSESDSKPEAKPADVKA